MPFEKGKCANPKGRGKGVKDKPTAEKLLTSIVDENLGKIKEDLEKMTPYERVNTIINIASYCNPNTGKIIIRTRGSLSPEEKVAVEAVCTDVDHE